MSELAVALLFAALVGSPAPAKVDARPEATAAVACPPVKADRATCDAARQRPASPRHPDERIAALPASATLATSR